MARGSPAWWRSRSLAACLLQPVSVLFGALAAARRSRYRRDPGRVERLPVPVIVVGNIAVGGSGKTPVVDWLVRELRAAGWTPGVVSRGYGGQIEGVALVPADGDPAVFGDEPVLLARLTGCPVAVGADRPAAARALLAAHPACNVLVSDDGLQHYRLARDVELVVVDERTLGNRWLLPAGPLREPVSRLREVDAVIAHGPLSADVHGALGDTPVFPMRLEGDALVSLHDARERCLPDAFRGRRVHAIAGIGRPERFFAQLRAMGLDVVPHPFPDHHPFTAADLAFAPGEPKILTSKDAVKCSAFAPANTWEFPVRAQIPAGAAEHILEKLSHGRPTA
ncbi:tetraacyldisaccharide 4'-kinase [Aromatoleum toluvorans]|uniref:Tetraacyldisaccharide 4'-kinase n=1 Tax=Aromatoleum toluvorans TaxID=92002 RepID=A0ABX1PZM5_9RHOO|nr:tetraacyldisaccharide 4'-kinase [Aromatoleum toluvorans]NMG43700.1 tetraacyldisaccharide 4'-kinase [Aromatoleum toluvorans]